MISHRLSLIRIMVDPSWYALYYWYTLCIYITLLVIASCTTIASAMILPAIRWRFKHHMFLWSIILPSACSAPSVYTAIFTTFWSQSKRIRTLCIQQYAISWTMFNIFVSKYVLEWSAIQHRQSILFVHFSVVSFRMDHRVVNHQNYSRSSCRPCPIMESNLVLLCITQLISCFDFNIFSDLVDAHSHCFCNNTLVVRNS